jgi:hypothetical protein
MEVAHCLPSILGLFMVVAGSAIAQTAEVGAHEDHLALSGVWSGSMSLLQRGKCSIGRSGRSDAQVRFRVTAQSDGGLLLRPESGLRVTNAGGLDVGGNRATAKRNASQKPWLGQVSPDRLVELTAPGSAVCAKAPREFPITYTGAFTDKHGRRTLTLSTEFEPCPTMGCTFRIVLDLQQRDDGRRKQ